MQNGQTAPKPQALGSRRRTQVRREAKFVHSIRHFYFKKCTACRLYRHAGQRLKNEGIFCECKFVGVRWYGRVCIRKKQETAREIRRFPCGFNILICAALKDTEVNFLNAIYTLLVVDRVFRQSEHFYFTECMV